MERNWHLLNTGSSMMLRVYIYTPSCVFFLTIWHSIIIPTRQMKKTEYWTFPENNKVCLMPVPLPFIGIAQPATALAWSYLEKEGGTMWAMRDCGFQNTWTINSAWRGHALVRLAVCRHSLHLGPKLNINTLQLIFQLLWFPGALAKQILSLLTPIETTLGTVSACLEALWHICGD